jgi:hypothetical protein
MERWPAQSFDPRKPLSPYVAGLKETFAPPSDPLPPKFEELLARLRNVERDQSKHLTPSNGDL